MFRKDINALRAIAVIAVVLFHFNSNLVPGGFAGVDVFFVISGFLMTGIVFKNDGVNFSLANFLSARATRIIPALFVLCIALIIFGYFYLYTYDLTLLLKHVKESALFYSNVAYYRESGYFDSSSHYKWLLHTWSLSVEWQFYVIFPVVIVIARRFVSLPVIKVLFLFATGASFLLSAFASFKWPEASYYLLPTRSWELMLGGVVYLYPLTVHESYKKRTQLFGVFLIFVSYMSISELNAWPGYLALIPVLGAYLILQSKREEGILANTVILQKIGLWSYSIYLWHWPLVVAFTMGIYTSALLGVLLSLVLGFISYTFIEKRKFNLLETSYIMLSLFVVFIFSYYTMDSRSIDLSVKGLNYNELRTEKSIFMKDYSVPGCNFKSYNEKADRIEYKGTIEPSCISKKKNNSILIWGDSHAQHLNYGLTRSYQEQSVDVLQIATFSCRVTNTNVSDLACVESNTFFWTSVSTINPDVILISQRNQHLKITGELLTKIQALTDSEIIVVGPSPEWDFEREIRVESKGESIYRKPNNLKELDNDHKLKELYKGYENIKYISMFDSLCRYGEQPKCLFLLGEQLNYLSADGGHFSRLGSDYVANHVLKDEIDRSLSSK